MDGISALDLWDLVIEVLHSSQKWSLLYTRKSNICSHKLDVQEGNVSVSQFHRIGKCFIPAFHLWDVVFEISHSFNNNTPPTEKNPANGSRAKGAAGNCLCISNVKLRRESNQNIDQL